VELRYWIITTFHFSLIQLQTIIRQTTPTSKDANNWKSIVMSLFCKCLQPNVCSFRPWGDIF